MSVIVTVGRGSSNLHRIVPTAVSCGYLCDLDDPVDVVVRRAAVRRPRPKPEIINDFPCLVLEVAGREGRQTLWPDTPRGHNLVKAEGYLTAGDILNGNPLQNGYGFDATLGDVQLQRINGIWLPTALTYDYRQLFPDGHFQSHTHIKFSRIEVNPDFDAFQAFVPVIEDGLRVRLAGDNSRKRYTWQQGEIIDEQGRNVRFR